MSILTHNVIVFGETGAGKSSIINMLDGDQDAEVGSGASGVTFSNKCYQKSIQGMSFQVFDTVGLNEGPAGRVPASDAVAALYQLISKLDSGVNLLVYVMRAPRITSTAQKNYEMFFEVFCQKQVPIVIVVTGLENEEDMDGWWTENKAHFDRYKMFFQGNACITAIKGKYVNKIRACMFEAEYEESKEKVEKLIIDNCGEPWKKSKSSWLITAATGVFDLFGVILGWKPTQVTGSLLHALTNYCGMTAKEARKIVRDILVERGIKAIGALFS
ncbi:hypothetical protein VKT23_012536 [Stygiomarasmius scandens]|uniref:AIG1-type G domain-containing protein n=1 Tax=Marasmiellus scandens TaxID=2682957 RepID=A0ABR1J6L9_9AGAR